MTADARRHAPATQRNREPILAVLRAVLPASGTVLEVASGSGEHALHFSAALPALQWQPSDPDPDAMASIAAWAEGGPPNLLPPLQLDAAAPETWPVGKIGSAVCINMIHISPWAATEGLFAGCGERLPAGAPLVLYGPYVEDGIETAQSNLEFDAWLKARDAAWGLRNVKAVDGLAGAAGFERVGRYEMPANNLMLVYRKR